MYLWLFACEPNQPIEKISDSAVVDIIQEPSSPTQEPSSPTQEPSIDPNDIDDDGDGYSEIQNDCDDSDPTIYPEATETAGDGIDQDCDGEDLPFTVRFVALGDAGEGNENQFAVADAIKTICDEKSDDLPGCSFAVYLGDNFYDAGVDSVNDSQFQSKFMRSIEFQ